MNYYIKESFNVKPFYPIAINRPTYDIIVGCMSLKKRLEVALDSDVEGISLRFESPSSIHGYVFSSHILWDIDYIKNKLEKNHVVKTDDGEVVLFYAENITKDQIYDEKTFDHYISKIKDRKEIILSKKENYAHGKISHISDIFLFHKELLSNEIYHYVHNSVSKRFELSGDPLDYYEIDGDPLRLFIKKNVQIASQVVFNVSKGPIIIEDGAQIGSFSYIEGPSFIGKNVIIDQAKVRGGSVILDGCKIGGEIEESIFMPFSNKHHEGFVGHSYIGQFVNLGALSTTSDLKNNYQPVSCRFNGETHDTKQLKIGSFIGDYTMLGIGSLLNTGTMIGLGCNLTGGTFLLQYKDILNFTWRDPDSQQRYNIDKLINTIKIIMGRRHKELTLEQETLIRGIYAEGKDDN